MEQLIVYTIPTQQRRQLCGMSCSNTLLINPIVVAESRYAELGGVHSIALCFLKCVSFVAVGVCLNLWFAATPTLSTCVRGKPPHRVPGVVI